MKRGGTPIASTNPARKNHPQFGTVLRVGTAADSTTFQSQQRLAVSLVLRSHLGDFVEIEAHSRQRRRLDRKWLRRPILVAGNRVIRGYFALFHLKDRLAGQAIEDEQQALLGPLRYGGDLLAVAGHIDQGVRG